MENKYLVEFDVPKGAILGGCVHMGGGVFRGIPPWASEADDSLSMAPPVMPSVNDDSKGLMKDYTLNVIPDDRPHDDNPAMIRGVVSGQYVYEGKDVIAIDLAESLAGMPPDEYLKHVNQQANQRERSAAQDFVEELDRAGLMTEEYTDKS